MWTKCWNTAKNMQKSSVVPLISVYSISWRLLKEIGGTKYSRSSSLELYKTCFPFSYSKIEKNEGWLKDFAQIKMEGSKLFQLLKWSMQKKTWEWNPEKTHTGKLNMGTAWEASNPEPSHERSQVPPFALVINISSQLLSYCTCF